MFIVGIVFLVLFLIFLWFVGILLMGGLLAATGLDEILIDECPYWVSLVIPIVFGSMLPLWVILYVMGG
ncbi:hypothetical protein D3C74_49460 [compost metagenome]